MAIQDDAKQFFLTELSRSQGGLPSLELEWLASEGYTRGSIDERWSYYLRDNGQPPTGISWDLLGLTRNKGGGAAPVLVGGAYMLRDETEGFGIDATEGGTVTVKDLTTPANNKDNTGLDTFIANSGTTPKLVVTDATGAVGWSPHNLFVNSASPATQNVTLIVGETYTYDVVGSGSLAGSSGASGTATEGNPVTFVATGTTGTFTVTGSLTRIQINRGPALTDYLATAAAIKIGVGHQWGDGIWSENASTNLIIHSNDYSEWTATDTTPTDNNAADPLGQTGAALITEGTAGTAKLTKGITITANRVLSASIALKRGNTDWVRMAVYETANPSNVIQGWFNLATGQAGSATQGGTATLAVARLIKAFSGGFYRFEVCGRIGNSATALTVEISSADDNLSATRVNNATYYAWHSQAEESLSAITVDFSSSIIPTFGATQTRAADDLRIALSSFPFSASAGTIYADVRYGPSSPTVAVLWYLGIAGANNINAAFSGTASPGLQATAASVLQANIDPGTLTYGARHQMTGSWATDDFEASLDGNAAVTDTSATVPTVSTSLIVGRSAAANLAFRSFIRRMAYVPATRDTQAWRYEA